MNTVRVHFERQTVMPLGEQSLFIVIITNILCRQNAGFVNGQAGGMYNNHYALQV